MPVNAFSDELGQDSDIEDILTKHIQKFILYPNDWHAPSKYDLDWDNVKFDSADAQRIPQQTGLYAFSLQCSCKDAPPTSYIMYIGIVGIGKKDDGARHLYTRYKEYLGKQKRPLIKRMLTRWREHLYFYFTPVDAKTNNLEEIETYLLGKLIPPFNDEDFPAHLRAPIKMARSI